MNGGTVSGGHANWQCFWEWPVTKEPVALLPASQFPAIPWFDWYNSIIPPFHPWSHELGMVSGGHFCQWHFFHSVGNSWQLRSQQLCELGCNSTIHRASGLPATVQNGLTVTALFTKLPASWFPTVPWVWLVLFHHSTVHWKNVSEAIYGRMVSGGNPSGSILEMASN